MCGGTRHEGPIIPLRLHHSPHIVNIPGYTFHQHLFHGTNLLISTYNVISVRKAKIFLFVSLFFLASLLSLANRLLMKWVGAVSGGWMKERKRKQTRFEGKTRKLIFFAFINLALLACCFAICRLLSSSFFLGKLENCGKWRLPDFASKPCVAKLNVVGSGWGGKSLGLLSKHQKRNISISRKGGVANFLESFVALRLKSRALEHDVIFHSRSWK